MSISAPFPVGWTLNATQAGPGSPVGITVTGQVNVVHVLDSIYAKLVSTTATVAAVFTTVVFVQSGAGVVLQSLLQVPAMTATSDELSLSGLDIASSQGGALVVAFFLSPIANIWEELTIQGHNV